ncbi:LacI family transcriptional regulator [Actinomycetospora endophytica]|uniref:LacI family transcriptional regulator n=1 Tax=Actinomycetospora endophytica TaxID=2291215 RepID=A0ABS8PBH0_9PSEU|nr:LacI family DNA-binding transcriptional regulator [Actinomycetospora endophytica]MCD2195597.1 LacI family transcriptional regulator [Actinomycetospora endophytica]
MGERGPTIYDVARHCGVAASTVSRVFSRPTRVGADTRRRVHAAAAELGYRPRPLARDDGPERVRTVTLVVSDIANPYYPPLIKAVQARAAQLGRTTIVTDSDESPEVEAGNLRRSLATSAGGILATSRLSDRAVLELAEHRPLVVLNRRIDGLSSLVVDTPAGMRAAVRHLVALGHRHLLYLSGPRNSWVNSRRWAAVHDEAGAHTTLLGPFPPTRRGGHTAAEEIRAHPGATAVLAYNDLIAIGAMERLAARGVRVPEDLSLIGCDDVFGADLVVPGLTTVAGPTGRLGRRAVDVLEAGLTDPTAEPTTVTLGADLVVRGTTGPPPGN